MGGFIHCHSIALSFESVVVGSSGSSSSGIDGIEEIHYFFLNCLFFFVSFYINNWKYEKHIHIY